MRKKTLIRKLINHYEQVIRRTVGITSYYTIIKICLEGKVQHGICHLADNVYDCNIRWLQKSRWVDKYMKKNNGYWCETPWYIERLSVNEKTMISKTLKSLKYRLKILKKEYSLYKTL